MTDLNTALLLLAVGMITVFSILSLVVLSAKALITIINRWIPAPIPRAKQALNIGKTQASPSENVIDKQKLAAIVAAVDIWTSGKGSVKTVDGIR